MLNFFGRAEPYLSICAMYRDEAQYLDEWIRFHVSEGVQHFYLYDDESTDGHLEVLDPWVKRNIVTLFRAEGRIQDNVFTDCLNRNKRNGTWMAFVDIDEFLFVPGGDSLETKLVDFENYAGVFVFWKLFGSGGLSRSTGNGVVEDCTYSLSPPRSHVELAAQMHQFRECKEGKSLTGRPIQGKSIVRIGSVYEMGNHFPLKYRGQMVDSLGRTLPPNHLQELYSGRRDVPDYDEILIHHYWSRSLDSLKLKRNRPGASRARYKDVRNRATMDQAFRWDACISSDFDATLAHRVRARDFPYIFVIGFNKTATRALAKFFTENGLPTVHWDQNRLVDTMIENLNNEKKILNGYDSQYRVFTDFISVSFSEPFEGNRFFREMDKDYPGAFFILNTRDTEDWLQSRLRHNKGKFLDQYMRFLGTNDVGEVRAFWAKQKVTHENLVREYFADSERFLELDIDSEDVPQQLEAFLGIQMNYSFWQVIGKTNSR